MALTNKLTDIADAIRRKNGKTVKYTLPEMVTAIDAIDTGGGGDEEQLTKIVDRTIQNLSLAKQEVVGKYAFYYCSNMTSADLPVCTSVGEQAFQHCSKLTTLNLPKCTTVNVYAFQSCSKLTTVNLPECESVKDYAFQSCSSLTSIDLPACQSLKDGAFQSCSKLTTVNLPECNNVNSYAFYSCSLLKSANVGKPMRIEANAFGNDYSLTAVIIHKDDGICTLMSTSAFTNCYHIYGTVNATYNPDGLKDGYIYVPDALVASYKTANNWSTFASQIKPLSELPA